MADKAITTMSTHGLQGDDDFCITAVSFGGGNCGFIRDLIDATLPTPDDNGHTHRHLYWTNVDVVPGDSGAPVYMKQLPDDDGNRTALAIGIISVRVSFYGGISSEGCFHSVDRTEQDLGITLTPTVVPADKGSC